MEWLIELDTRIFLAINGFNAESLDGVMWWISGKTTWWPFYLLLLTFLAWKKRGQLIPMILFVVLVITLTDQSSVHLFKNLIQRLRPSHEPALEQVIHLVNNKRGGLYGFISSHAANAAGVAVLLSCWIRRRWFSILMVVWAVLIGYSRIYLGVHYPGDVIGGLLWGSLCGWLIYFLFEWIMGLLPAAWWITRTGRT